MERITRRELAVLPIRTQLYLSWVRRPHDPLVCTLWWAVQSHRPEAMQVVYNETISTQIVSQQIYARENSRHLWCLRFRGRDRKSVV